MTRNWTRNALWLGLIIGLAVAGCTTVTPAAPTGTPAPTDTPVPPTVAPPPSGEGAGQVQGTITAYETNEKGGNLFVMALGVVRDEQGQPVTSPDVDIANLPKAQADAEGKFTLPDLPAGEYVFAVNKDGDSNNPNTSLIGTSDRQIMVLAVKPSETTEMDGYFLQERLEQPTPVAPATPPVAMVIDTSKDYTATIKTDVGDIKLELYADRTPVTVNNFVSLARKGFYDNTTFHRVIEDFMAQGGDPTGTGTGGPGYTFMDEILADLTFDEAGVLAMANSGPHTNGSQFFITFAPTPWLDGQHTIFGKVVEGEDVLPKIVRREPEDPNAPAATKIVSITIEEK